MGTTDDYRTGLLTYYGDEYTVRIIIFLTRKLARVFSLYVHAGHARHNCEVRDRVWLREAIATKRPPVGKSGQSLERAFGAELAFPLGALDVTLLSQISAAQNHVLSQEGCDVFLDLNHWLATWKWSNTMRTWISRRLLKLQTQAEQS